MMRVESWDLKLTNYFLQVMNRPFKRGEHDCALFVCDCINILRGVDFAEDYRGKYKTKKGAFNLLRKKGHKGLESIADASLPKLESIKYAIRGDIVSMEGENDITLGVVCSYNSGAFTPSSNGLVAIPSSKWLRAWRV